MAEVINLATADYSDTGSKTNLKSGTFRLLRGTWTPKVARPAMRPVQYPYGGSAEFSHFPRLIEVMELRAEDTNANIIAGVHAIDLHLEQARHWFDDKWQQQSRWLEWEIDGETRRKRALLYSGALELVGKAGMTGGMIDGAAFARLALERHPLWESVTLDTFSTSNVSCLGGEIDLTTRAADTGSVPGRIGLLALNGRSGSGPMYRYWVGIRDEYHGSSSFDPKMEVEDGTAGAWGDTSDVVSGSASGGYITQCDFATDTSHIKRCYITLGDHVGSNYHHFVGRYQVLLRMACTSGTDVAIQLKYGFEETVGFYENEIQYHEGDGYYYLVPLGEIQIPPGGYRYTASWYMTDLASFEMQLWAERLAGTGNLSMDCLILMPAEHMITLDKADTNLADDQYRKMYLAILEDDTTWDQVYETASFTPSTQIEVSYHNWTFPLDPGVLVVAGERETGNNINDAVDVVIQHWARWKHWADT